jgi:hypothetical protein
VILYIVTKYFTIITYPSFFDDGAGEDFVMKSKSLL